MAARKHEQAGMLPARGIAQEVFGDRVSSVTLPPMMTTQSLPITCSRGPRL